MIDEEPSEGRAGEVRALIGVEDLWAAAFGDRFLDGGPVCGELSTPLVILRTSTVC